MSRPKSSSGLSKPSNRQFATVFPQGKVVWVRLPWGKFRHYSNLFRSGQVNISSLEEEIYQLCVVEEEIPPEVKNLAGTISTVVKSVLALSGSSTSDAIYSQLDQARQVITSNEDQITALICLAFPYKPEDIEQLPWDTVLRRLAQAELVLGIQFQKQNPNGPQRPQPVRRPRF